MRLADERGVVAGRAELRRVSGLADFGAQIDAVIDDGDLTTGMFQKVGGKRYYFVVAE